MVVTAPGLDRPCTNTRPLTSVPSVPWADSPSIMTATIASMILFINVRTIGAWNRRTTAVTYYSARRKLLFQDVNILPRAHILEDFRPDRDADLAQVGFAKESIRVRACPIPPPMLRGIRCSGSPGGREISEIELAGHLQLLAE